MLPPFGKWHLGDQVKFLPTRQGFDFYLEVPFSDDITVRPDRNWPPLLLMRNEAVIEAPVGHSILTKRVTKEAFRWIESHRNEPFFFYFPQCMSDSTAAPFVSSTFKGSSESRSCGDSVEELDWSVGEILRVSVGWDWTNVCW